MCPSECQIAFVGSDPDMGGEERKTKNKTARLLISPRHRTMAWLPEEHLTWPTRLEDWEALFNPILQVNMEKLWEI